MAFLKISNKGKIEPKAFEKIGFSTKKNDDTKIGEYGSGLNYAIAWLMRNKIKFHAFSGHREILFSITSHKFRGEDAEFIVIDGKETSFCVDMGGTIWEPWMVIREIYCNALDEENPIWEIVEEVNSEDNKTCIFIDIIPSIKEVINKWDYYFSFERKDLLYTGNGFKLFKGGDKLIIYRKGIKCYEYNAPSIFHYDIDNLKINESRIVKDTWDMDDKIVRIIAGSLPEDLVITVCNEIEKTYEANLRWDWFGAYTYNDSWKKVLSNKRIVESEFKDTYKVSIKSTKKEVISLPKGMVENIKTISGINHVAGRLAENSEGCEERELLPKELNEVEKARLFLAKKGYFLNASIKGLINNNGLLSHNIKRTIYLSEQAFDLRKTEFFKLLIKEQELIRSDAKQKTLKFEKHLIDIFFNLLTK